MEISQDDDRGRIQCQGLFDRFDEGGAAATSKLHALEGAYEVSAIKLLNAMDAVIEDDQMDL
ncbi:MAG: hypothetical protein AAFZ09_06910, partial [Pseudomonadota bacterium]